MSLVAEMAYGLKKLIADMGYTVTIRHETKKDGANPAINPPQYESLKVSASVLAGVSTIVFAGNPFTGRFIIGDKFTIAGDLTEYTVSAEAISPTLSDTVTVQFTPVLVANAAADVVVTVTSFAADATLRAVVTDRNTRLRPQETVQSDEDMVRFLNADLASGVVPTIGDKIMIRNVASQIVSVDSMEMSGTIYGWSCVVRR